MNFLNRCAVRANEGGTDNFILVNGIPGFYTPPLCLNPSVVDGATYRYFAVSDDGTQHEEGDGVWNAGANELTRDAVRNSSNGGSQVTFSAAPIVFMGGPTADDVGGGTTSDVLSVTGSAGAFEIETLRGIRQVNLTAPDAGSYGLNINEYPIPGQTVEFVLSGVSDPAAEVVGFGADISVGRAQVSATLSSAVGNSVALLMLEGSVWQVVSQNCKIAMDEFTELLGVTLTDVNNQVVTPADGDTVVPCFTRIGLNSSGGGAAEIEFDTNLGLSNPAIINFAQSDPGDSFVVDPTNFRSLDGSTPSDITFDADGESMALFMYTINEFLILSASPGVVTP